MYYVLQATQYHYFLVTDSDRVIHCKSNIVLLMGCGWFGRLEMMLRVKHTKHKHTGVFYQAVAIRQLLRSYAINSWTVIKTAFFQVADFPLELFGCF